MIAPSGAPEPTRSPWYRPGGWPGGTLTRTVDLPAGARLDEDDAAPEETSRASAGNGELLR